MVFEIFEQGLNIFRKSSERASKGWKKYGGKTANTICRNVIKDCWNGDYLMTSTGHFNFFWTRDTGLCAEALVKKGFKEELSKTINYALKIFQKNNKITTSINSKGRVFDHPTYSVDTLPWMLRSLILLKDSKLVNEYFNFLDKEARRFYRIVFNPKIGLVKRRYFSSIRDYAIRDSSTYDNVMVAMIKQDLDELGLYNPFKDFDIKARIKEKLWNGEYFNNDLSDNGLSSDANIFPFITGVFNDKQMLKSAVNSIIKAELEQPLPVEYSLHDIKKAMFYYILSRNYQGTTAWTNIGPLYIKLVKQVDAKKAASYKKSYKKIILDNKNYLEVFNSDLKPFKNRFYMSDEGMLWAANYLDL